VGGVAINNRFLGVDTKMTVRELSQLYYLNCEIEQDKERLAELEAKATSSTFKITGLPHIKRIADKTALAIHIADMKEIIEAKLKRCMVEHDRLIRYINIIDDSLIRQILMFRYINGFSWLQISMHIGGGNTEDGVRMLHNRFLKKNRSFCSVDLC
jgi:hypothetical protein